MDVKELTDLLAASSQRTNQSQFIPWWEDDFEKSIYWYSIFSQDTIRDANACLAQCPKETLLAPAGTYGLSLFHLLVWHNFFDAVKKMLEDKTIEEKDINLPDQKGYGLTPFLLACCRGNLSMARLLLDHGADDKMSDKRGMNACHFLAYPRFEGLVNGCTDKTAQQREAIARLLTCDINQKDQDGFTPLARLLSTSYCSEFTWPLTEVFLDQGADTDYVDEAGNSLLMLALMNGHTTAALQLMNRHKELVHVANQQGKTPMEHSHEWGNQGMCLALADCGAAPIDNISMDIDDLSRIASNAFSSRSEEDQDNISLALFLTEKLIEQMDVDDEDELGYVTDLFHNALLSDKKFRVLDACSRAGLDFTMPLHFAGRPMCLRDECLTTGCQAGIIRKLMELGVDMESGVIRGQTPANLIASQKRRSLNIKEEDSFFREAAELLSKESMEQLDNNGIAAIHLAARNGHTDMLAEMIKKGVNINLMEDVPAVSGTTPLHEACTYGRLDAVKLLMDAGADDTIKDSRGNTPAHCAVISNSLREELAPEQRAKILKELNHLDLPGEDGRTPFMLAQLLPFSGSRDLLPIFVERGVEVNHTDHQGITALILAAGHSDKDAVKLLLKAGADINLADNEGNTALHDSLESGDAGIARYLIKKGAHYNQPNNQGKTSVQIAVEKGLDTVLELMTEIE